MASSELPILRVLSTSFVKNQTLVNELTRKLDGKAKVYFHEAGKPMLTPNQIQSICQDAKGLLVGGESFSKDLLDNLPNLKVIAKYGVGLDNLDLDGLAQKQIALKWIGGVNAKSVAEHAIGLMIGLLRNIGLTSRLMTDGVWYKNGGESLFGKKVGIVGLGYTGFQTATALKNGFGCSILANDILDKSAICQENGFEFSYDLEKLLVSCDILSLHLPLTSLTKNLFSKELFDKLVDKKPYLINVCRGEVVHQKDLIVALKTGQLKGAGSDVFWDEPNIDKELLSLDNFMGTPHTAGNSKEAILSMGRAAITGLEDYFS